jgi:hypothetical protein
MRASVAMLTILRLKDARDSQPWRLRRVHTDISVRKGAKRHEIEDLKGKLTGEGVKREKITVKQCYYEDLWKEGARDTKNLAAWDRIGVTDSFWWIASASALISILSSMLNSDSNSSSKATQSISYLERCVEVLGHALDTSISQEPLCSKCTVGGYRNQIRSFVKVCL